MIREHLNKGVSSIALKMLIVMCLFSGAWGTSENGTGASEVTAAVAPPVWQFTFRDAPGDTLLSDGNGPYIAYTPVASTPCPFSSPGLCGRDLDVIGCSTGLHNNVYLSVSPTKCPSIGETVLAWALIEFRQANPGPINSRQCNSFTCSDMFVTDTQPYPTTFTRTGKNTYVWRATDGLFDHYLDDCNNLQFVEQCPLTFEATIFKARL